jgi:hypothetical protein
VPSGRNRPIGQKISEAIFLGFNFSKKENSLIYAKRAKNGLNHKNEGEDIR